MANARNKTVDTTYLSLDNATERGFIHRDYIAHCLRWTHVIKRIQEKQAFRTARILDVGCGRELPFPKTLYSSRLIVQNYYGVDVGPINDDAVAIFDSGKFPLEVWEKQDVLTLTLDDLGGERVNWLTCFEVLEHVEPIHMLRILNHLKSLLRPDARCFFSTPCWDIVSCAANHVNEMKYTALGALFEANGWTINAMYGTFASIRDYEAHLTLPERQLFDELRDYYDVNFLACVFAPKFPQYSRNCIWELQPVPTNKPKFQPISTVPEPWGSSANYKDMAIIPD